MKQAVKVGDQFGSWTVLAGIPLPPGSKHRHALCRCICRIEKPVSIENLRTGASSKCRRCALRKPLEIGTVIGTWRTVSGVLHSEGISVFACECIACGAQKNLPYKYLKAGGPRCCVGVSVVPSLRAALHNLFLRYKGGAQGRGFSFQLDGAEFEELTQGNCFYCQIEPRQLVKHQNQYFSYNGVDRLDNTRGYEKGNVVSCCGTCNKAKGSRSVEEFKSWLQRLIPWVEGTA